MKATTRPVVNSRPTPRQRKYDSARHKRLKPSGHAPSIDATNLESPLGRAATEWRLTIDAIPDVIVVCDPNGAIHRLNRSALLLLGGTYSDWVGQPVSAIESRQPIGTILRAARHLFVDGDGQTQRIREDETGGVWDVSCTRWETLPNTAVVVARNVTEMVRLEESLARAEAMAEMGRLLGAAAHEVRNPLFGISALLEAWSVNLTSADPQAYMALLTHEVNRLRTLMAGLLEYGRPFTLTLKVASLQGAVLEAIRTCERQAATATVTLSSTLSESLVKMDSSRLSRVFINLLENAIQHSPAGSGVSISIQPAGTTHTSVHVTDAGPGFADEILRHLFTPFHSRRHGGTGLGLAIAKRIVDEHGGTISVRNDVKRGATVTVTLPTADYES
jgi:PAS domain S-box-containing protein